MRDRVTRRLLGLVVALTANLWVTNAWADGVGGNVLEILSPAKGYVTGESTLDVPVRFTAGPGSLGNPERLLHTLALTFRGVEVGRLEAPVPSEGLTHTFTLDLAVHAEGSGVLEALAYSGAKRVALAAPIALRIDRDASDGIIVGPGGGVLRTADGALTLTVPAGALSDSEWIIARTVDPSALPPLAAGVALAFAYELRPHGLQFAQPVDVAVRLPGSTAGGPVGHAPVIVLNQSGTDVEALGDQRLVLDLATGEATARGSLLHFSNLFGVLFEEVSVRVDGVPDIVEVGDGFIATATVTDTESVIIEGTVAYSDPDLFRLRRVEPSPSDEPFVILGGLRGLAPDRLSRELVYVCAEFGMGLYRAQVLLRGGRVLAFGPSTFESSVEVLKPVFCHAAEGIAESPESFPARIGTSIAPLDAGRRVGESVDIELRERASGFPPSVSAGVDVRVVDLSPGVLSEVPDLSPAELRLQSGTDRETGLPDHRFSVGLPSGSEQRQTLRYTCLASGMTTLRFTFVYSFVADRQGTGYVETLLATVTCGDAGRPPVVTSSPPPGAVVGVAYTYDVEAVDPEGQELTYSLADAPLGMRVDFQTGVITWTPDAAQAGPHEVVVLVTDATHVVEHRYTVRVDGDADGDGTGDAQDPCPTAPGGVRGCGAVIELADDVDVYCLTPEACAGFTGAGDACMDCSIVQGEVAVDCQSRSGSMCTFEGDGMLATTGGMLITPAYRIDCTDARCTTYAPATFLCEGGPGACVTTYADLSQTRCPVDRGCSSFVMPVTLDPGPGPRALLRIDKVTDGGDGTFVFDVGRPGGESVTASITTEGGAGTTTILVNAERASVLDVIEDQQPGWEADQPDCNASWLLIDSGAIAIRFDGPTTCVFTNRRVTPAAVPLLFGLTRVEAEARIIAAGLVPGTVTVNDESDFPAGTVEFQSPPPFTQVPSGTAVDLVVAGGGSETFVVEGPERLTNVADDAFAVGSTNTIAVAGSNGFSVVNPLTGGALTGLLNEGPWFGAIVVRNELGNGEDAVIRYGPGFNVVNIFDRALGQFGITLVERFTALDASHAGGDPASPVVIRVAPRDVLANAVVDFGFGALLGGPLAPVASASNLPGVQFFVSAAAYDLLRLSLQGALAADSTGWVLAITDGTPGRAYLFNPRTPFAEGLLVGEVGDGPRTVRCLQSRGICAVANFLSGTATIILWDGQSTATIVGHVPVDAGAVSGSLREQGVNVVLLVSGFTSNTATKITLSPAGIEIGRETRSVSAACDGPAHALWIWNTVIAALSCNRSNFLEVFPW